MEMLSPRDLVRDAEGEGVRTRRGRRTTRWMEKGAR